MRKTAKQPSMIVFGKDELGTLVTKASESKRNRAIHCFSFDGKLPLNGEQTSSQAFINCIHKNSYVRPHKHAPYELEIIKENRQNYGLPKNISRLLSILFGQVESHQSGIDFTMHRWELFVIISGVMKVMTFDKEGVVQDISILSTENSSPKVAIIPSDVYHTVVALENSQVFELKKGWFDPEHDKDFPAWAPSEDADNTDFLHWLQRATVGEKASDYKQVTKDKVQTQPTFFTHDTLSNHRIVEAIFLSSPIIGYFNTTFSTVTLFCVCCYLLNYNLKLRQSTHQNRVRDDNSLLLSPNESSLSNSLFKYISSPFNSYLRNPKGTQQNDPENDEQLLSCCLM